MKVDINDPSTCYLNSLSFTMSDTLVPNAFLEHSYLSNWVDVTGEIADIIVTQTSFEIPDLTELCTVTNVEENSSATAPILIFPSPVSQGTQLTIQAQNMARVEIRDALGRLLMTVAPKADQERLSTERLSAGCYFLNVFRADGGSIGSSRFIVR
jgi:hypothetical protein